MKGTPYVTYPLVIAAGRTERLEHYARFVEILENNLSTDAYIRFPDGSRGVLPKGVAIELPQDQNFQYLEFENPAGGAMTIIVGLCAGKIYDNRLLLTATSEFVQILGELQGDLLPEDWGTEITVGVAAVEIMDANANRKGGIIQAKESNTANIYLGFLNNVTSSKWIAELQPGMAFPMDDYRGPIFAISTAAAQLVGWGEW